jgi:pimeloyl-ACP methyl ester carboxylesterase
VSRSSQRDLGSARAVRVGAGLGLQAGDLAALCAGATEDPPVLLVPGYTGTKEDFGPILDAIAASGLRAVAIDLPGQYESAGPDDVAAYTTAALGEVVRGVAAELGAQVHLVGHSFGGLVSRAAVLAEPGLFSSLVLMDSGPAALGGSRAALITHLEPLLAAEGLAAVYAATEAIYRSQPGYVAPPEDVAALLRTRFLAGSPAMLAGMGQALRSEPDRVAELAATAVPTLVLYGRDDDAWSPSVQDEMAGRLGAGVVAIADAVHSPAVENPAATAAALIDFWRGLGRRGTLAQ